MVDIVFDGSITPGQTAGIIGTTTNNVANAGSVGEYLTAQRLGVDAVSLTNNTDATVISLELTAGDYDMWGNVLFKVNAGSTVLQTGTAGISTVNGTLPGTEDRIGFDFGSTGVVPVLQQGNAFNVKALRVSISSTTTYYLVCRSRFTTSTCSAFGTLNARRRR